MNKILINNLKTSLEKWTDSDVAAFYVGIALNIIPSLENKENEIKTFNFHGKKWIFWTDNPLGNFLHNILEELVALNILEKNKNDECLYRWNSSFCWDDL